MVEHKGIILAGGLGTRLHPVTYALSKQLLPVYDKPMIYYPLSMLMLAGIRDISVITTSEHQAQFRRLLGDGSQWGISLHFIIQNEPKGLAHALILTENYLNGASAALVLGDNIFFGHGLPNLITTAAKSNRGATIFGYKVSDPQNYGVVDFDKNGQVLSVNEKPEIPSSDHAIVGLYFFDGSSPLRARELNLSHRGELEITSLIKSYMDDDILDLKILGRGVAWFDAGKPKSLLDASNFVRTLTERQGMQVGSPEEVSFKLGWIDENQLLENAKALAGTEYGASIEKLLI